MDLELGYGARTELSAHDRAVPVERIFPSGAPPDALVVDADGRNVVLCCPITRIPLTVTMALAAGLTTTALQAMVHRICPLGIATDAWEFAKSLLGQACSSSSGGVPALTEGGLHLAIGGSSVACFSSRKTALEKKRFPASESELELQILNSPLNRHEDRDSLSGRIQEALELYRSLGLVRPPRSPWHGILARLGIEGPPDIDVQISSDVIDQVLGRAGARDPNVMSRRRADRLGRWHPADVYQAFPALEGLRDAFRAHRLPLDLEFLGPGGQSTIGSRTDWWHLDVRRSHPLGVSSQPPHSGSR